MSARSHTYSFKDIVAAIVGPGGIVNIGSGAANADEGISIEFTDDKDTLTTGADGSAMHSLHASQAGKVTIRLLKTSPANALLAVLYNFQTSSAQFHGQNVITITDIARGDVYTCEGCAFTKFPNNTYAKAGGNMEWEFNAAYLTPMLGGPSF